MYGSRTIPTDFREILRTFVDHEVDFILVGALAAVLQGAPITTLDVDLVHSREEDNLDRLLEALDELEAEYRSHLDKQLRPNRSHLDSDGHQLLETSYGPLDLLGTIEGGLSYEVLLPDTVTIEVETFSVRALSLERYVDFKQASDRPKDQGRLPTLRETLRLKQSEGNGDA